MLRSSTSPKNYSFFCNSFNPYEPNVDARQVHDSRLVWTWNARLRVAGYSLASFRRYSFSTQRLLVIENVTDDVEAMNVVLHHINSSRPYYQHQCRSGFTLIDDAFLPATIDRDLRIKHSAVPEDLHRITRFQRDEVRKLFPSNRLLLTSSRVCFFPAWNW